MANDKDIKPGKFTSEFWVTIAAMITGASTLVGAPIDGTVIIAGVAGIYTLGRSIIKAFKR